MKLLHGKWVVPGNETTTLVTINFFGGTESYIPNDLFVYIEWKTINSILGVFLVSALISIRVFNIWLAKTPYYSQNPYQTDIVSKLMLFFRLLLSSGVTTASELTRPQHWPPSYLSPLPQDLIKKWLLYVNSVRIYEKFQLSKQDWWLKDTWRILGRMS